MTADPHPPTTAGPTPSNATAGSTGSVAAGSPGDGNELPFGIPPERPEILVGAAFAGGVLAALILKRLGGS